MSHGAGAVPGPVYAYDRSFTAKGKAKTPSYSMSSRSTLKNKACNPGAPDGWLGCGGMADARCSVAPGQYNSVDMGKSSTSKKAPGSQSHGGCHAYH